MNRLFIIILTLLCLSLKSDGETIERQNCDWTGVPTDINGCVDSTKSSSFVIVDPNPKSSFSWTPENPTVLINQVDFVDWICTPQINFGISFGIF